MSNAMDEDLAPEELAMIEANGALFAIADPEGNGVINTSDIPKILAKVGSGDPSEDDINSLTKVLDPNNTGTVDFDTFVANMPVWINSMVQQTMVNLYRGVLTNMEWSSFIVFQHGSAVVYNDGSDGMSHEFDMMSLSQDQEPSWTQEARDYLRAALQAVEANGATASVAQLMTDAEDSDGWLASFTPDLEGSAGRVETVYVHISTDEVLSGEDGAPISPAEITDEGLLQFAQAKLRADADGAPVLCTDIIRNAIADAQQVQGN
eukprot:TRINITY_DN288_c0_g1_i1.p3 TRINITY_DN288_c0_g1~~TRINITY_DN288_c0_g1_i1.p3  ORF type:complete len:264 (+),score=80.60 TRINITY_DN288_c0_g1_i1:43-834(+)